MGREQLVQRGMDAVEAIVAKTNTSSNTKNYLARMQLVARYDFVYA